MHVKDYMQEIIIAVSPNDLLSTARRIMNELFIRHLPVVLEGKRLVGILTDRDLRQASPSSAVHLTEHERNRTLDAMTVSDIMTRQVYTVSPNTTLLEVATTFLEQKFDCLPVVDEEGALKGLITVLDFVRLYVEQHENVIV
jgi:acetoin utilization protein AcuB